MVSWDIFASIGLSFLLMLLPLPVLFIFLWRKRDFPVNSFFSGAAVFIVFYLVVRYYVTSAIDPVSVLSLMLAAIVVEGGRLVGFLILPRKEEGNSFSLKTGLSLALGYMTAAFLLINAFEMAMNFVYAGALEGWGMLADYLNRFPPESVDRVQTMISTTPGRTYFLEVLSLYLAVPVQLVLTLLVFQSYRVEGRTRWLFLGVAILLDFFYFQVGSAAASLGWAGHIAFLILMGGVSLLVMGRLWKEELIDTFSTS